MIQDTEARVNFTYDGQNYDLPDPVHFAAGEGDIKTWVTEAIRSGSVPGLAARPNVDLTNYMVDYCAPTPQRDHKLILVRPKTAFG